MSGITLDELNEIQITDGTDTLEINADGSLNAVVTATNLDIRDLVNTQDSVAIGDSTDIIDVQTLDVAFDDAGNGLIMVGVRQDAGGSPVSADGDAHPFVFNDDGELKVAADLTSSTADDDADAGNPIKVGGRGVSGVLTALSATGDRYDLLGDLFRRTWVNDSANIAIKSTAETVETTIAEIVSAPLVGRRFVTIQNEGSADVFVGATGITTATGAKISKRSSATFQWGEDINIFMIASSAGQDVRVLESA